MTERFQVISGERTLTFDPARHGPDGIRACTGCRDCLVADGGEGERPNVVREILDPLIELVETSTAEAAEARSEATTLREDRDRIRHNARVAIKRADGYQALAEARADDLQTRLSSSEAEVAALKQEVEELLDEEQNEHHGADWLISRLRPLVEPTNAELPPPTDQEDTDGE